MSKWPSVTCIVCTHNRPKYLPRALNSILSQTYQDYEVIVIHDGPPQDETKKICEMYSGKFEKVGVDFAFMSTDEGSGYYCVPRNSAILHAKGDYIAHLDDDNEWRPHTLASYIEAIEEGTVWPDFVYGKINYKLEEGASPEHNGKLLFVGEGELVVWDEEAMKRLAVSAQFNFIDSSSFMASKGAYWRLHLATGKMFNEMMRRYGDWEIITRAVYFAGWRGKEIDKVVLDYWWGTEGQLQLNRAVNEQVYAENIK